MDYSTPMLLYKILTVLEKASFTFIKMYYAVI